MHSAGSDPPVVLSQFQSRGNRPIRRAWFNSYRTLILWHIEWFNLLKHLIRSSFETPAFVGLSGPPCHYMRAISLFRKPICLSVRLRSNGTEKLKVVRRAIEIRRPKK